MMVMMMNQSEKDGMTVTGTQHRQVSEVLWKVHSRDEVRYEVKSGYFHTDKQKK